MSLLVLILKDSWVPTLESQTKGLSWRDFHRNFFLFAHLQTVGWGFCDGFMADDIYLFETAHKVVTDWWPWEVCCARTASNIEKVIRAQHGVVFLRVSRCGQNSIHWYCHLDNKAQGKDTLYSDLHTGVLGYAWFWDLRRNPFSCLFEVWSWILVSYP